jgi:hypothetical protein
MESLGYKLRDEDEKEIEIGVLLFLLLFLLFWKFLKNIDIFFNFLCFIFSFLEGEKGE